jgi:hypothetical protein
MNNSLSLLLMKRLNVVSISHVMPSGSTFLHSLFDSHSEVITIPGYTDIFSLLNYSFNAPEKALEVFNACNPDFYDTSGQTIERPGHGGLETLGEKANEGIITPKEEFKTHFLDCISGNKLSPENIILSIYYAYTKSHNQNIHSKKIILMHPHYHDKAILLHNIFGNTKCLVTVKHPVRTYFSCIDRTVLKAKARGQCYNHASSYLYREAMGVTPLIEHNIKFKIVRIEDFECNVEFIMNRLCDFVGIKYDNVLTKSTFGSKKYWGGNPSYKANKYSPSRHKKEDELTHIEENIFYLAFRGYCNSFGYDLTKPKKYLSFFAFFTVFLPMRNDVYWLKNNFFIGRNQSYDKLWSSSLNNDCISRFQVIMSLLKERALIIKKYYFYTSNNSMVIKKSFVKVSK